MTALAKVKSFFRRTKATAKAEEPKPAPEATKKEAPQAPEKKG